MIRIGLLSDTHGFLNDRLFAFFDSCHELWHAGDIGSIALADQLAGFRPLKAVYGNIDGHELRSVFPSLLYFLCEQTPVLMTHIGGYPGHYDRLVLPELMTKTPKLFICGHSHILRVIYDKKFDLLHINPGAAGNTGIHKVCTAIRFTVTGDQISDLDILEIPRRSSI